MTVCDIPGQTQYGRALTCTHTAAQDIHEHFQSDVKLRYEHRALRAETGIVLFTHTRRTRVIAVPSVNYMIDVPTCCNVVKGGKADCSIIRLPKLA